jgi:hypothetical protein
MRIKGITVTFLLIATTALILSCERKTAQCPLCQREIHAHMQVSITHNSLPLNACCMSCALTYQAQTRNVEIEAVTDFVTDAALDPQKAIYVVGSEVSPCTQDWRVNKVIREPHSTFYACYDRCLPNILAFKTQRDAQQFQQKHAGVLSKFDQLLKLFTATGGYGND